MKRKMLNIRLMVLQVAGSTNTVEALPGVKIELLKVTEQKVEEKPVENPDGESTEVDPKTTEAQAKGIEPEVYSK